MGKDEHGCCYSNLKAILVLANMAKQEGEWQNVLNEFVDTEGWLPLQYSEAVG